MFGVTPFNKGEKSFYSLNFGPQHPAAHGVLRLILVLTGEEVLHANPHIGLLHRGTEKLREYKTIKQIRPYFDRLDYVSIIANEHTFIGLIENILKVEVKIVYQYRRIVILELTRILNHLIALTTHIIDVGAITPFLWGFEEREKIFQIYENICGARIHANWVRVGGINVLFNRNQYLIISEFCNNFNSRLDEIEELLTINRIWFNRTFGIGIITFDDVKSLSLTGVIRRSAGIKYDLRITQPYERYKNINFNRPIGCNGDCYDRYLLRLYERRESLNIIQQCLRKLDKINVVIESRDKKRRIENVINHFKVYSDIELIGKYGRYYNFIEAPKGEFGVNRVLDGKGGFYRLKIKSPGLSHLFSLNKLSRQLLLADIVTIIGTQDIVFGEIDR